MLSPRVVALVAFASVLLASGIYLLHAAHEEPVAVPAAVPARHDSPPPSDSPTPVAPPAAPPSGRRVVDHVAPAPVAAGERPQIGGGDSDDSSVDDMEFGSGGPKLEAVMSRANKEYDRGEYADAKAIAEKVLAKQPNNVRMARIMVSSSCMDGDTAVGQKWFNTLPPADRQAMAIRCKRNNVVFQDPPGQ